MRGSEARNWKRFYKRDVWEKKLLEENLYLYSPISTVQIRDLLATVVLCLNSCMLGTTEETSVKQLLFIKKKRDIKITWRRRENESKW